jgi:predicted CoA-binding protein
MAHNSIEQFLEGSQFAVAGASANRAKYGNKVLRAYLQNGYSVVALHPSETRIEGVPAYSSLSEVPHSIDSLSIITPPRITESLVEQAIAHGVKHLWMQPGAESEAAISDALAAGLQVIYGGPCLLVRIGFRE